MHIYLDFNASTPVAPEVAARMEAVLHEPFGNPSSDHWAGTSARVAVETARAEVAALLGCDAGEVVFTSGGSEAIEPLPVNGTGEHRRHGDQTRRRRDVSEPARPAR